ncbi:biopolymer transporter ExbD [candidate division KSB1 bacterium]|nr:biopolymer transporter ExbD [candidate division KSB1 bacterium]
MAFKPSLRRTHSQESAEPNLTPIMNLMVVLIPLLLTSAQFIKLGIIELNLPPSVGPGSALVDLPKEKERKLDMGITISEKGFILSSSMAILKGDDESGVSIPVSANGEYDYEKLNQKLMLIKTRVEDKFPDTDKIVIMAESDIVYQVLVSTMDAARAPFKADTIRDSSTGITKAWTPKDELFPQVSISAGVIF